MCGIFRKDPHIWNGLLCLGFCNTAQIGKFGVESTITWHDITTWPNNVFFQRPKQNFVSNFALLFASPSEFLKKASRPRGPQHERKYYLWSRDTAPEDRTPIAFNVSKPRLSGQQRWPSSAKKTAMPLCQPVRANHIRERTRGPKLAAKAKPTASRATGRSPASPVVAG